VNADLEHEPIHDPARLVTRSAEETQHAAQVPEHHVEALERRSGATGRAERILGIAAGMHTRLGQDELSTDDLYHPDTGLPA
jgi:hypothetical protein